MHTFTLISIVWKHVKQLTGCWDGCSRPMLTLSWRTRYANDNAGSGAYIHPYYINLYICPIVLISYNPFSTSYFILILTLRSPGQLETYWKIYIYTCLTMLAMDSKLYSSSEWCSRSAISHVPLLDYYLNTIFKWFQLATSQVILHAFWYWLINKWNNFWRRTISLSVAMH